MAAEALSDVISAVVAALEGLGVPYAVTGSVVSSIHGEPMVSYDVDFIVKLTRQQASKLAQQLSPRFYCDEASLADACDRQGMANVIDMITGLKVDFSVMPPTAFREDILRRSVTCRLGSGSAVFKAASPEDIILMKLDWRRESLSTKQWHNALSVVRRQGARLDWNYLMDQARRLGLLEDLVRLRDEGGV